MEEILTAFGVVAVVLLLAVGLVAGWLASLAAGGRDLPLYLVAGALAALAAPIIVATLGLAGLIAYGLVALLVVAAIGAVVVLVIVRLVFGDRRRPR